MSALPTAPLSREALGLDAAPARIVHLGLGNFHRAHQAWYTDLAVDGADWGIAAFSVRGPGLAERLSAQDGLYSLIERGLVDHRLVRLVERTEAEMDDAGLDLGPVIAGLHDRIGQAGRGERIEPGHSL